MRIDDSSARKSLKQTGVELEQANIRSLERIGAMFVGTMIDTRLTGRPGLMVRTGTLRRSLMFMVDKRHQSLRVAIGGGGAPYALVHEGEGTGSVRKPFVIRASPGKALAIPVGKALTASGVPRYQSPRDVPDLKLIPRPGKAPLLARVRSDGGLDVFYVLKKRVEIPPRLGFNLTWETHEPEYMRILDDGVQTAIKRTG